VYVYVCVCVCVRALACVCVLARPSGVFVSMRAPVCVRLIKVDAIIGTRRQVEG
jgi:hypothetical protein